MTAPAQRGLSVAAAAGLALFTLLSYFQHPGHVFLESDTQVYLPMLERFRDPSLYQRDPMVVRAHTAFTLYDEASLGLSRLTGLEMEAALGLLHLAVRFTLLAGIFLITRAMGLSELLAVACAGVYALGGRVLGPSVLLMEIEPVPRAFALGPVVLAVGLAGHGRYLAAGVAGAAGFLLHATTAAPFWMVYAALLFVPDEPEEMKKRLWGLAPLAAAVAILAAASAAQPGVLERQALLSRLDESWESLIRLRATYVYVSLWPSRAFWQYGVMLVVMALAARRLRPFMQPPLRFLLAGLVTLAVLSVPATWLFLEKGRWAMMPQWQPGRAVLFLQMTAMLLALVMAFELACKEGRMLAAWFWAALGLSAGIQPRTLGEAFPAVALGGLLVAAAEVSVKRRAAGAATVIAVVAAAFFVIAGELRLHWSGERPHPELADLSRWSRDNTDKNAVFLFADAGRALDPGVFRARSRRAVYVDWKSGGQINFFREFTRLWWSRWQQTMAEPFRPERVPGLGDLGIDYLVLDPRNRIADRKPAWENSRYVVYEISASGW